MKATNHKSKKMTVQKHFKLTNNSRLLTCFVHISASSLTEYIGNFMYTSQIMARLYFRVMLSIGALLIIVGLNTWMTNCSTVEFSHVSITISLARSYFFLKKILARYKGKATLVASCGSPKMVFVVVCRKNHDCKLFK